MFVSNHKINLLVIFFYLTFTSFKTEIVTKIDIVGNERISSETIKMFAGVSLNDDLSENDLNIILKKLYDTNFFDLVSVKISNKGLFIKVKENPIIQNIDFRGIKALKILEGLKKNTTLKSRSSFNEVLLEKDKNEIKIF